MIPISITMQAFGPYKERKFIDFERLNKKGLFLITGNTGSGKTTILDAMCMALYCKSTGGLRSFKELRNSSCKDELDTIVEFVFRLDETVYKFQRALYMHNIRGKDKKELRDEHSCYKKNIDSWDLIESGAESKVRAAAEDIIGLDCDQFSKVIVLPQGEFKSLLLASSIEKAKIFTALFKTDKYQHITNEIQSMSNEIELKLEKYLLVKNNILKSNSVCSVEELDTKLIETERTLQEKKEEQLKLAEQIDELRKIIEAEKNYMVVADETEKRYKEKEKLYEELKKLEVVFNDTKNYDEKIEQINLDEKHYLDMATKYRETLKKAQQYAEMDKEKVKYQELLNNLKSVISKTNNKVNDIETYLHQKEQEEQTLKKVSDNLNDTYEDLKKAEKQNELFLKLEDLQVKMCQAKEKLNELNEKYNSEILKIKILKDKKKEIEENLFSEDCVRLAQELKPNQPCPVCGSLEHPCAANKFTNDKKNLSLELKEITGLIEQEEKQFDFIKGELEKRKISYSFCKESYECQVALCEATGDTKDESRNKLLSITQQLNKQKQANEKLKLLKMQLDEGKCKLEKIKKGLCDYQKQEENAKKSIDILLAQQKLLKTENSYSDLNLIQQMLNQSLKKVNECEALQKKLIMEKQDSKIAFEVCTANFENAQKAYNESNQKLQQVLKQRIKLNKNSLGENENILKELINKNNLLMELFGRLSQTQNMLKKAQVQITDIELDYKNLEIKYSKVEKLAQLLSGANPQKVPIKIFVLGIMLDDVLCRANIYFSQFSNSRYSLSRADKSSSRGYNGLDIDVFDAYYGSVRPVKTLSGGELFLASLSLAFGLSDTIQSYSGGIRIESIFIDEGFGSLDFQTLETAIEAFSTVINNGRIIGIISHVDELKNRIEAKIQVN